MNKNYHFDKIQNDLVVVWACKSEHLMFLTSKYGIISALPAPQFCWLLAGGNGLQLCSIQAAAALRNQ